MPVPLFWFAVGVLILVISSQWLVKSASYWGIKFKISPLVVGTTIIALGTSLPELLVSIVSVFRYDPGLALGNVVGSNIGNVFFVLAFGILLGNLRVGTTKTPRNALFAGIFTLIFASIFILDQISIAVGWLLLASAFIFSLLEYSWAVSGRQKEDQKYAKSHLPTPVPMILIPVSLGGLLTGGLLTVSSAENLASIWNISTTTIGLSLVALSTSLPELLVTIISQTQRQAKLALGNILGSNIYNLLIIGGTIMVLGVDQKLPLLDWIFFLLSAVFILILVKVYQGKNIPRSVSLLMFALYAVYLYINTSSG